MRDLKVSILGINAEADALARLLDGGFIWIMGDEKAETADAPVLTAPLATLRFGSPAFAPAAGGVIKSNPIEADRNTAGTGKPKWLRAVTADLRAVFDGTVGANGCNLNIQTNNGKVPTIFPGGEFAVDEITYRVVG